jgi:hypothetical protein
MVLMGQAKFSKKIQLSQRCEDKGKKKNKKNKKKLKISLAYRRVLRAGAQHRDDGTDARGCGAGDQRVEENASDAAPAVRRRDVDRVLGRLGVRRARTEQGEVCKADDLLAVSEWSQGCVLGFLLNINIIISRQCTKRVLPFVLMDCERTWKEQSSGTRTHTLRRGMGAACRG